jgi:hypothetical protein
VQTPDCVGPRVSKRQPLRLVGAQAEAEAEVAMRGRLRCLRQGRHDQRMARVDRYHRSADTEPRHRRADQPRQCDRVVIELLGQPDLADPEFLGASGLGDHIIDEIDGLRLGYNVIPVGIT